VSYQNERPQLSTVSVEHWAELPQVVMWYFKHTEKFCLVIELMVFLKVYRESIRDVDKVLLKLIKVSFKSNNF